MFLKLFGHCNFRVRIADVDSELLYNETDIDIIKSIF